MKEGVRYHDLGPIPTGLEEYFAGSHWLLLVLLPEMRLHDLEGGGDKSVQNRIPCCMGLLNANVTQKSLLQHHTLGRRS